MDNLTAGNPVAHRVRVYYTGDDALKEGEPLCYSFKTTKNWWGGSVSDEGAVTASITAAEGTQNASKYMSVESPLRLSLSSDTPASGSKTITGTTTDFDTLHVGMFVSISGTDVTNGNYEITAISRSTESGVTNSTITLGNMTAATGVTADVATKIDNVSAFAGVVARGGWVGKTGPRVIDIYVPNGAVVPVRTDQACILGRTILSVHSNEQHLTGPYENGSLPVAIAWETDSALASAADIILAKLNPDMFIHQTGDTDLLLIVDDQDTGNTLWLNQIKVDFKSATGNCCAFTVQATSSAGAAVGSWYGLALYIQGDVTATPSSDMVISGHWLNLTGGTPTAHMAAMQVGIYESGATMTSNTNLTTLWMVQQITDAPAANSHSWIFIDHRGTYAPDFLFRLRSLGASSDYVSTSNAPALQTGDLMIPIRVASTTYYLVGFQDTGL